MKRFLALVGLSTLAAAALVLPVGSGTAGAATQEVYVVHGIPGIPVDVCVGDSTTPAIPNFQPGDKAGPVPLAAGDYLISLHQVGQDCDSQIYAETVTVPTGSSTIVAWNTSADGGKDTDPDLAVFTNDVSCTQPGLGRITARHAAGAAGPVDVFAGATKVVDLDQGTQAVLNVPVGTYAVTVKLDGTDTVVLGPADVPSVEGKNVIVHVVNQLGVNGTAVALQPASAIVLILDVGVCAAPPPPPVIQPAFTG